MNRLKSLDLIIGDYKIYCKGWNESMQERNIGLDIMRIAAMLGIIMLHVLGVGGEYKFGF